MTASFRFAFAGGLAVLAALLPPPSVHAQAAPAAAGYTGAQAEAGKTVFERACTKCHQADLAGKDDAPPLAGPYFASSWGGHKVSELVDFVKGNMPFDAPGTLDEPSSLAVVAYVLSRNGIAAGPDPLAKGDARPITVPGR